MIDNYDNYKFSLKENIRYTLEGLIICGFLGFLFYQNILGVLVLSPLILIYRRRIKSQLLEKRKWKLNQEFRDAIVSISAALNSGYSAENAFYEAWKDLKLLYKEESLIMQELSYIINQIKLNVTVEKALSDFARRTKTEDITNFAEIFTTAKRTGGDLIKIIHTTAKSISEKIEVKREIITLITGKKYEADIMKCIPPVIILYLNYSSPGFLDPLYHNILGIVVMTILLATYLVAFTLADQIVDINI
ncbi:MAG: hypothetical protein GX915_00150 [Clostridiales bacterium]|nr:hypothetical protein [Clostridiales bacterium]